MHCLKCEATARLLEKNASESSAQTPLRRGLLRWWKTRSTILSLSCTTWIQRAEAHPRGATARGCRTPTQLRTFRGIRRHPPCAERVLRAAEYAGHELRAHRRIDVVDQRVVLYLMVGSVYGCVYM
jgi:hypothetical protein